MDIGRSLSKVGSHIATGSKSILTPIYNFHSQYKNIQATKKDVLQALDQYRALIHSLDWYVFNDGSKKELVKLCGTIPVTYKSELEHLRCFF